MHEFPSVAVVLFFLAHTSALEVETVLRLYNSNSFYWLLLFLFLPVYPRSVFHLFPGELQLRSEQSIAPFNYLQLRISMPQGSAVPQLFHPRWGCIVLIFWHYRTLRLSDTRSGIFWSDERNSIGLGL